MELTIEEKLDRLEAGLAAIGQRLDALEAARRREELAQWEADKERWAADDAAGGVAREESFDAWVERRVGPRPKTARGSIRLVAKNGEVSYPRVVVSGGRGPANPAEVSEAAVNEEEERQFGEAMQRLDMCSDGGFDAAAVAEDAKGEAECGVDRSFYFPRTDAERRGARLSWPDPFALTDQKLWVGYR